MQKVFDGENQKSDVWQQVVAVSTQISSVSTQISHVNTTVMRLADQQAELGRSDYHKGLKLQENNSKINEIYDLAKQNQYRLDSIESKLDMILKKLN